MAGQSARRKRAGSNLRFWHLEFQRDAVGRTVPHKMRYDFIDTGRLIDEVRIRRCLWDTSDEMYKERDAKNKAWEEIGRELFGNMYDTQKDKQIRQRWKSARDNYFRTLNKKNMPSGSATKQTKYIFFEQMRFLEAVSQNEVTESSDDNISIILDESSNDGTTVSAVSENIPNDLSLQEQQKPKKQDKPKRIKKNKNDSQQSRPALIKKGLSVVLDKNGPDISPDDTAFFNSCGPILKGFSSYQKLTFRTKVLQLVMDISTATSSQANRNERETELEDNSNASRSSPDPLGLQPASSTGLIKMEMDGDNEVLTLNSDFVQSQIKREMDENKDEFDSYGQYVASEMRETTDEHSVLKAKSLINNVLLEMRMGKYKNHDTSF